MYAIITQDLGAWVYLLLALLVMVEGPVATLAGAVAASAGLVKPELVFFAAASGNLVGDILWFTLGYLGKIEWLERAGVLSGARKETLNRMRSDVRQHAPKILFLAKLTLGFTIPSLVATGLARVPVRRWLPWLLLAETIWTGVLVVLGIYFGQYIQTLERGVELVALAGGLLSAGALFYYLSRLRQRSRRNANGPSL